MSTNVGAVDFELLLNSNPFNKGLKNASNNIKSSGIENSLKSIGKAAIAAFSVKAVVDFTKSCLELGSNLSEVQNVVDVTFGNLNSEVDKFAQNAIEQFGLGQTVTKKYVGTQVCSKCNRAIWVRTNCYQEVCWYIWSYG